MNLTEAYSILGLPSSATPDDAKKKFRELSKKYHPDNSETGDEAEFKRINQAHQYITKPETRERQANHPDSHQDPFSPFVRTRQNVRVIEEIHLHVNLTFPESILGCERKISFKRKIKCQGCNGQGLAVSKSNCDKCKGTGQVSMRGGNITYVTQCDKCGGKRVVKPCDSCSSKGVLDTETNISVDIPGGVSNSTVLRLQGHGNFMSTLGPWDQYTDAFVEIKVDDDADLKLINNEVVSQLNITLLDAIKGCKKNVKTIKGEKEIEVSPLSRNKDEIIIPNVGVNGSGNQKVILDVQYPKNIDILTNHLAGVN